MSRTLLLVTGAGRSGTSTMAGALAQLGVHVPGPYLQANPTNPRGFYESQWSVRFHNQLLKRAAVAIADGRPEAADIMLEKVRDEDREQLTEWLRRTTADHPLTVVKDPRIAWEIPLWSRVGEDIGLSPAYVVMLRHPAEVLGSRATHYASRNADIDASGFATKNLSGWVNAMLTTERSTRGRRRMFVGYDDLLADWHAALAAMSRRLDLTLPLADERAASRVEAFVDPDLSRHRIGFDDLADLALPSGLRAIAESVWTACTDAASAGGPDGAGGAGGAAEFDAAHARFVELYDSARRLAVDHTAAEVTKARRQARRAARKG
ncbi:MAG: sulfotransferase family protein [Nocardioidaceae bacterium]